MSLPLPWVDKIFEKLTLVYGQQFLARWRDIDLEVVKADWALELASLEQYPAAITYALQNLDADKPTSVLAFRNIARNVPAAVVPRLPEPAADPARVAAELVKFASYKSSRVSTADDLAWAHRLKARHVSGDRLSSYQVSCYRTALRMVA